MYTIENETLKIAVRTKGAELDSIYHKTKQLEYLWSGDPNFWGKKSPVLFPIVGALKHETYYYQGKKFHLSRHGFAREMEFTLTRQAAGVLVFTLESNAETLAQFPFPFRFDISYTLIKNQLEVMYTVTNMGREEMYFSVGAHPAFKIPLVDGTAYEDYSLLFNYKENARRWPISKDGLIESQPVPLLNHTDKLPLRKELFMEDALVFKQLKSDTITLQSAKTPHGWSLSFPGFPYMGIWAAKNADFVCIEPWCGIADAVTANQQLDHKEGILSLNPGEVFSKAWTLLAW